MLVRLGPQECKDRDEPDYIVHMVVLTVLIYMVMTIAMWCVFPLSVGFAPTMAGGMILVVGAAAMGIIALCLQFMAQRYPNLSILQLDAHSDMRDEYEGSSHNHACVMARAKELTAQYEG
jgi:hypothetical protein